MNYIISTFPNGILLPVLSQIVRISIQELKCLALLSQNKVVKVAAAEMGVSEGAFEYYVNAIKKKTCLNSRQDLVKLFQDEVLRKWY